MASTNVSIKLFRKLDGRNSQFIKAFQRAFMNRDFGVKQRKCARRCIILVENELKCDVARLFNYESNRS